MARTFPLSAGIIEHRARMGTAIWEYLYLLDHVTSDEPNGTGKYSGVVDFGNPLAAQTVANALKESLDTAKVNLRTLETEGYVSRTFVVARGHVYTVTNSKKWAWKREHGGQRVENPSMEKPADERVENPSMLGKKPAADRWENPPHNKERKEDLLRRVEPYIPAPQDGADGETLNLVPPDEATKKRPRTKSGAMKKPASKTDPRFTPTRKLLADAYNGLCAYAGKAPWDGHAAKELRDWLVNHDLEMPAIEQLVGNAAVSERGKELLCDPAGLIPKLRKYHVPLDRFGNPMVEGKKNGRNEQGAQRVQEAKDILRNMASGAVS